MAKLVSFASILDDQTRAQAERAASMPFVHPHIALMPDAHLGKGATVGSVIPTLGAVIPAAVGVDIGCGMMAVRTRFHREDLPAGRAAHHAAIALAVPLSAGRCNASVQETAAGRVAELESMAGAEQASPGAARTRSWTSTPETYKPIDVVMHDARDLVEVVHTLRQVVNVKRD